MLAAPVFEGRAWFEENHAGLTALVRVAEEEDFPVQCWQLARACWRLNFDGGHLDELIETHTIGLRVAERLGDETAIATMLNYVSSAYFRLARLPEAISAMEVALSLRRHIGLRGDVLTTLQRGIIVEDKFGSIAQSQPATHFPAHPACRAVKSGLRLCSLLGSSQHAEVHIGTEGIRCHHHVGNRDHPQARIAGFALEKARQMRTYQVGYSALILLAQL